MTKQSLILATYIELGFLDLQTVFKRMHIFMHFYKFCKKQEKIIIYFLIQILQIRIYKHVYNINMFLMFFFVTPLVDL